LAPPTSETTTPLVHPPAEISAPNEAPVAPTPADVSPVEAPPPPASSVGTLDDDMLDVIDPTLLRWDHRAIDRLIADFQDDAPAVLPDLVSTFMSDLDHAFEEITNAYRAHDLDAMRRRVHSLKSSAATLGANRFSKLCAELEEILRE